MNAAAVHARITTTSEPADPASDSMTSARAASSPRPGIVIATVNRPQGDTGVHVHTRALRDGLEQIGIGCQVVSPFDCGAHWLAVFGVRPLLLDHLNKSWSTRWYRHWHTVALRRALVAHLTETPAAAIIAQCPLSALAALDARRQLELDVPIIAVCHFNHSEATEYRDKGELASQRFFEHVLAMEQDVMQRVDGVIYVSQWARDVVEHDRGIQPRSSQVIWNGIVACAPAGNATREQLGLSARDLVLMNVGSLEPRKNQLGLLDLFAAIAGQYPAARLLLVGDGPQRGDIERRVAALGLNEKVKLLGFRNDVPALLAKADLYVHYATLENCPVVLLEAARAELPSAALPAGGVAEIIDALGAGVILSAEDLQQSVNLLEPLLREADLRRELGREAQAGFLARFTRDAMVRSYVDQLRLLGAQIASTNEGTARR